MATIRERVNADGTVVLDTFARRVTASFFRTT
jgi:hypothetical protein